MGLYFISTLNEIYSFIRILRTFISKKLGQNENPKTKNNNRSK